MQQFYDTEHGFRPGRTGVALLLLRLVVGAAFILHGAPKVADPGAFAAQMHFPPALGALVGWAELLGGGLVLLGLFTPLAAAVVALDMVGALLLVHFPNRDPFVNPAGHSFEIAAVYLVVMLALLLEGAGAYSADAWLYRQLAGTRARIRGGTVL